MDMNLEQKRIVRILKEDQGGGMTGCEIDQEFYSAQWSRYTQKDIEELVDRGEVNFDGTYYYILGD